jgi:hypothetical protein
MNTPCVRPLPAPFAERSGLPLLGLAEGAPASPQRKRAIRPGWKATIVRAESFARLRAIQKSTADPAIDLSYLTDACLQMALEMGAEAIVRRALEALVPPRTNP